MARSVDLMGLGLQPFLARAIGDDPILATAAGATQGSATQLNGTNSVVFVNASNSGSGVQLPLIGGTNGALLGDDIKIANLLTAAIQVYSANNGLGSAVQIYIDGGSITGTTGFSVTSGKSVILTPITVSAWIGFRST